MIKKTLRDKLVAPTKDEINILAKQQFSQEAINYLTSIVSSLKKDNFNNTIRYYNDTILYMEYDKETKDLYVIYKYIWKMLEDKFNYKFLKNKNLIKYVVESLYNLEDINPIWIN